MDKLTDMRKEIDALDHQIIALLGKRFQVTERVGILKAESALAATDSERESAQYKKYKQLANQFDIDEALVESLFALVIENVVARHKKMIN